MHIKPFIAFRLLTFAEVYNPLDTDYFILKNLRGAVDLKF